jgi:hypothetical protein
MLALYKSLNFFLFFSSAIQRLMESDEVGCAWLSAGDGVRGRQFAIGRGNGPVCKMAFCVLPAFYRKTPSVTPT